jgi:hypothetical protein
LFEWLTTSSGYVGTGFCGCGGSSLRGEECYNGVMDGLCAFLQFDFAFVNAE